MFAFLSKIKVQITCERIFYFFNFIVLQKTHSCNPKPKYPKTEKSTQRMLFAKSCLSNIRKNPLLSIPNYSIFKTRDNTINPIARYFVIFSNFPSIDRPLFLPQYVSVAPATEPDNPPDFPSCINTIAVKATQITAKITVTITLKTATIPPPAKIKYTVELYHKHFQVSTPIFFKFPHFLKPL